MMTTAEYNAAISKSCTTCYANAGRPCRNLASGIEMPHGQTHAARLPALRSPPYGTPGDYTVPT